MVLAEAVTYPNVTGKFPELEHALFKGAYIVTMDQQLVDIESADIHIGNGQLSLSVVTLELPVRVINAARNIAMPGLVGLDVDTTGIAGDANMFEVVKGIQNVTNATTMSEYKMSAPKPWRSRRLKAPE